MDEIMFTVYVLRSLTDNKRCIGYTSNLQRRLSEHNSGKVKSTRNRKPFELSYSEVFVTKTDAQQREKFFKTHSGRDFLDAINK